MSLLKKEPRQKPNIITESKQVVTELNETKINILNDSKKADPNNNILTDDINGYTNPGLKDVINFNVLNRDLMSCK